MHLLVVTHDGHKQPHEFLPMFFTSPSNSTFLQPVDSRAVPTEVALMQMVNQPPICRNIIRLMEWFDEPDQYILVLEHPDPCVDLLTFFDNLGGYADEDTARTIMLQDRKSVV